MEDFISSLRAIWWVPLLAGALGILIGAFPNWYALLREWFRPKFLASIHTAVSGDGLMMMHVRGPMGWEHKDINLATYVRFTNNREIPTDIVGYLVEAGTTRGWRMIPRLEVLDPMSVEITSPDLRETMGMDRSRPLYLDLSENGFDVLARRVTLQFGHSIAGWAFFRSVSSVAQIDEVRISVFDSQGVKTTLRVTMPKEEDIPRAINRASFRVQPENWVPPWIGQSRN